MTLQIGRLYCLGCLVLATANGLASDLLPARESVPEPEAAYSPYVDDHFPIDVYFGDTHLHSSWSTDAGMVGGTAGPDVAYRVSRGEEVVSSTGQRRRCQLHKYYWNPCVNRTLGGPGIRCATTRLLLRPGTGNSYAALDRV